jgi:hypothetical protein
MLVTKEMLEDWIGSDNMDSDSFLNLLCDIVNGKYPIDLFRQEVLEYAEEYFDRTGKHREENELC